MKQTLLKSLLVATLLLSSNVYAHDVKLHKGKPTEGVVTLLTQAGFDLKTDNSSVPVKYGEGVTFESEHEGNAKAEDIKPGVHVSVFGTKLASGELVAKEIHVHSHDHADTQGH